MDAKYESLSLTVQIEKGRLSPMTKARTPTEKSEKQRDNTQTPPKTTKVDNRKTDRLTVRQYTMTCRCGGIKHVKVKTFPICTGMFLNPFGVFFSKDDSERRGPLKYSSC